MSEIVISLWLRKLYKSWFLQARVSQGLLFPSVVGRPRHQGANELIKILMLVWKHEKNVAHLNCNILLNTAL